MADCEHGGMVVRILAAWILKLPVTMVLSGALFFLLPTPLSRVSHGRQPSLLRANFSRVVCHVLERLERRTPFANLASKADLG
jgi:hypothetical protein